MVYKLVSLAIDIFVNLKSTLLIVDLNSTKAWNLVLQVRLLEKISNICRKYGKMVMVVKYEF